MTDVINALLNMILVSIPEETFIVVISLVLLKRFDFLDVRMWRHNLKWIMIPVIPVTFFINLFRYVIVIPKPIMSLSTMLLMIGLMIYIVVRNSYEVNKRLVFKVIISTILGFVLVGVIEEIYYPLLLSLLHKPIEYFNNIILYNFLLAVPTRILQFCVVVYIIVKKNNKVQVNLFNI